MSNMIKVNYYDAFQCIADQCPFGCCQEWRISVDEQTLNKWEGVELKQSGAILCDCVEKEGEDYIISLEEDKKCPFLNKDKLCKIVLELGEEFLSDTCTRYPRHIKAFDDRKEYSLDFGCPVVIDLINENLNGIKFHKEETKGHITSSLYKVRDMILGIMEEKDYSLTERIMMTFYCLLELQDEQDITEEIINSYKSRLYLKPLVKGIRKMNFNLIDSFWERNELYLDIVQLYRKQELYTDYLEDISTLSERLEEYYSDQFLLEKSQAFEKEYMPYQKLLTNYLVAEIWGNCLESDMVLEDMIMVFQWIIMEYCVIKQAIFLKWLSQDQKTVEYSMVKDYIMVISRVAGYGRSDIKEYLENSFENIIMEWGYLALILGNGKL